MLFHTACPKGVRNTFLEEPTVPCCPSEWRRIEFGNLPRFLTVSLSFGSDAKLEAEARGTARALAKTKNLEQ